MFFLQSCERVVLNRLELAWSFYDVSGVWYNKIFSTRCLKEGHFLYETPDVFVGLIFIKFNFLSRQEFF